MPIYLDGSGPLFQQVYRAVRDGIVRGRFTAGDLLPPSRALAGDLGVSRATVLLAYEQLAAEGYVAGRQGSGTRVQGAALAAGGAHPTRPSRGVAPPVVGRLATALCATRRLPLQSGYAGTRSAPRWDFRYGVPSLADFPLEAWQRCLGRAARRAPARAYDYGSPQGSPALRGALAEYLGRARGVVCAPDQIVVVTGSQQGIDLAARLLLDPGDRVVVEEPGYEGARNAFRARDAELMPAAVDHEGVDPTALPAARLALVTPAHQFPLGGVLSWTRRAALLAWAATAGAWVIEDDYDAEYRFDGRPVPPLKVLDADDRVIHLGTLSKVMFPALRIGYLVLPRALVEPFTRAKLLADGGGPRLEQEALAAFIAGGAFERHIRRSRARNAARRAALLDALAASLGGRIELCGANAGLHVVVWVRGLAGGAAGAVARRAAAAGVGIYPVTPYYLAPPRRAGFILGYGALAIEDIRAGVARLAAVLGVRGRGRRRHST